MRIQASVGNAPRSVSLHDRVYKLTLTGESHGEMQWLAGLYQAVLNHPPIALKAKPPILFIVENKKKAK